MRWNARYQNPEKAKTNDNCVTNYRPASDPHESKGGEMRYKIRQRVAQLLANIVSLLVLGRCFAFFICVINLSRNKNLRWSFDVGWGKLLRKVECGSALSDQFWLWPILATNFNLQLVTQQIFSCCATGFFRRLYSRVDRWPIDCYSCRLFKLCFDWIQFKVVSQFLYFDCFMSAGVV